MTENGSKEPRKHPKTITLPDKELLEMTYGDVTKELAELTESSSGSALVNLALTTLAWVVENKRQNKRIVALSGALPTDEPFEELDVYVSDAAG